MADLEELKERVKIENYLQGKGYKLKRVGSGLFETNPCPVCGHNKCFRLYENTNSYTCFSSNNSGSIIDLIIALESKDKKEAIQELYSLAGETYEQHRQDDIVSVSKKNTNSNTISEEQKKRVNDYISKYATEEHIQQAIQVLERRGITEETIRKYNIFIGKDQMGDDRITIPIIENNTPVAYIGRAISNNSYKYINSPGKMNAFNIDYIKQPAKENEVIYICEGVFDALSLEQAGVKAIATNSVQQYKNLFTNKIKDNIQTASKYTYILSLDNDQAGQETTTKIAKELSDLKIQCKTIEIPKQYKDINEWYIASDKGEFARDIKQNIKDVELIKETTEAEKNIIDYEQKTVASYIGNSFLTDIRKASKYKEKTTGFKELDKALDGVYPGLYVLGAISSLGKTTFIHQIADQMAKAGESVIYFSLEQSQFELVAKSISRQIWETNKAKGSRSYTTSLQIMREETPTRETIEAVKKYGDIANNIIIEEGNFNTSVKAMREYIKDYIETTGKTPNIFIDYLQILPSIDNKLSDKQQIDRNVTELKRISRDFDIPIFVICSFNRENYTRNVDYTSFKESGGIEYTADVVLGLQLTVLDELSTSNQDTIKEEINKAKSELPRKVTLVGLKNRSGNPYFKIKYNFFAPANYFEEVGEVEYR